MENEANSDCALPLLTFHYSQFRKHGRRLVHMHAEERHAARIAAKKLRYSAEFFENL